VLLLMMATSCTSGYRVRRAYEKAGAPPPTVLRGEERRATVALIRGFWNAAHARDSL